MKKFIICAIALIAAVSCNNEKQPVEREVLTIAMQVLNDTQPVTTEKWEKMTSYTVEVRDGKIYTPDLTADEAFCLEFGFVLSEYGKRDITFIFPNDYRLEIKFHKNELYDVCYEAYLVREIKNQVKSNYGDLPFSYERCFRLAEGVLSHNKNSLTLAAERMLTVSL